MCQNSKLLYYHNSFLVERCLKMLIYIEKEYSGSALLPFRWTCTARNLKVDKCYQFDNYLIQIKSFLVLKNSAGLTHSHTHTHTHTHTDKLQWKYNPSTISWRRKKKNKKFSHYLINHQIINDIIKTAKISAYDVQWSLR